MASTSLLPQCVAAALLALATAVSTPTAVNAASDYSRFYGTFTGEALVDEDGVEHKRDMSVTIEDSKEGFNVAWTTTTVRASGKAKTKKYSIDFVPTNREGIYSSAMKKNVFGGRVAHDPMQGDPYVWARIVGDTLTIYALVVLEEGGYQMQVYDRTLSEAGLELEFSRIRNGERLRNIATTLKRQAK